MKGEKRGPRKKSLSTWRGRFFSRFHAEMTAERLRLRVVPRREKKGGRQGKFPVFALGLRRGKRLFNGQRQNGIISVEYEMAVCALLLLLLPGKDGSQSPLVVMEEIRVQAGCGTVQYISWLSQHLFRSF